MSKSPIERAAGIIRAERIAINGHYQHTAEDVARAVFESIDRDELVRIIMGYSPSEPCMIETYPVVSNAGSKRKADAIVAHLLSEGGES